MRRCQPFFPSPFEGRSDENVTDESVVPGMSDAVDHRPVKSKAASAFRRATKPGN